ncbi:two-component system, chemotaxis family, CheB/CheR fusion protein [Noviherbaspirillum humi]|uniref:Virulence sensor protein BvgS n=1 Tax=Noviherbaspirillum humi TaxID=1688639 RepID=A0A239IEL2_9BURK|nr:CheR family methyltransferase [Noviherbaspirillum humi]SNS91995.1 two-component system, chemotaxis family, CheB/CheR fusion protein [Noviherbaspirillum humi]
MDDNERQIFEFPPPAPGFIPSSLPFCVVGIGASAGGIDAVSRFLEAMPAENGMAFVIVLHLSPKHQSSLDKILQVKTRMPVSQVTETVPIEPNHVYIISPTLDLLMNDGTLQVVSAARPPGRHVAIDLFLRTLAEVHRERAIGIILSGAGSDGAVGIARIKEKGGLTLVQALDDAEYDSMPRSALERGTVDLVLPVVEMPQKLLELTRNARLVQLPSAGELERSIHVDDAEAQAQEAEYALRDILEILQQRTGHDFKHYKRATVLRRIERRLQVCGLANVIAYRHYLERHDEEASALLQDMLISVTNFFRDRTAFEALERDVVPRIFEEAKDTEQIRAWSVGCATGEEAYSIAMLLADQNGLMAKPRPIQVFASDIDEQAVATARTGLYPSSIITDVTPTRLREYFDRQDEHFRVKREIREKVLFAIHNILQDPPFSRLHLISCRNLLIYLDRDVQTKVLEVLHYALYPNGYLFLGTAESADAVTRYFTPVDKKSRIYRAASVRSETIFHAPSLISKSSRPLVKAPKDTVDRRHLSPQDLYRQLVEISGPPGILIDQNHQIIYATKQAGRYLYHPGGEPSRDILVTLHPDLQLELRAALFRAAQGHMDVQTRFLSLREGDTDTFVRIRIHPARDHHAGTGATLLLFEERDTPGDVEPAIMQSGDNSVAMHLEQELTQTKEQLRTAIEQYEATLEDLKGTNEELQASNEELRSTAEELETSKEELQSINEELTTVNNELKTKVDETAKANDDLQNFLSATEIATLFIDRNLRIKRYSKPCTRLFNLISSDINRSILDITYRLDYPELGQDIEQVFDSLQPSEREVRGTNDGVWYIARLLPYRTAEDRIEGLVLSFIDISRRKLAEEKLRGSEQRMRLIAASTRDYAISTMDADGIITSWNSGAERLFGYTEADIVGQSGEILFTPEDREAGAYQDELRRAREDGRAEDDRWHLRRNGMRVYCSGITSPLVDDEIGGYVKIARDLTDAKWRHDQQDAKLEWERQERIRAEEAARVRDEFFAVLSHELKQPLNLIQLTAEMLSRIPEAAHLPAISRGTATIKRMVEGQARIIDDLMDLSRLHTGKLTLTHSQLDVSERVCHVVRLMEQDAKHERIRLALDASAQDLIIQGDVVRIEQIIWNLLSNALKFTPAGGTVQVRVSREDDMACIEVADTGKGIAPEFLPHVFDMFRQANNSTTRQHGGMGIGLALVKELVHSHGGRVEAQSAGEGRGAQFRVYLPLAVSQPSASPPEIGPTRSVAGKRVLLVDDSIETLEALTALLTSEGAQVLAASSGAQALELVERSADVFHLIVSDIGMPDMDGYALLAALRAATNTATTPAIALSGFTRPSDVDRALAAGFETHMRKPIVFAQFIAAAGRISR